MKKRRVEAKTTQHAREFLQCLHCGSIWTIRYEIDGKVVENEPRFRELDSRCECGGTRTYKKREWGVFEREYIEVECHCGAKVECHHFTNTCKCGADYNWDGDLLAPRRQWGEETGEDWWECY
jgi:hypothetical protein